MRTRDPRSGGAQGVDGRYNTWRSGAPGPHAHGNAARQVVDDRRAEVRGQRKPSNDPRNTQHNPGAPTTGLRERGNDTSKSTGRSGRQNAPTRRNMRREERVTVQGSVKEQQPDGTSRRGSGAQAQRGPVPGVAVGRGCSLIPKGVRVCGGAAHVDADPLDMIAGQPQPPPETRDALPTRRRQPKSHRAERHHRTGPVHGEQSRCGVPLRQPCAVGAVLSTKFKQAHSIGILWGDGQPCNRRKLPPNRFSNRW